MASANLSSGKRLPPCLMELLDIAVFSFTVQSGLRASDKVHGDPVIEGVCALFSDLLVCAKQNTRKAFDEITAARLGNRQPEHPPTKEVVQMVSSRLQRQKAMGFITDGTPPAARWGQGPPSSSSWVPKVNYGYNSGWSAMSKMAAHLLVVL